MKTISLKVMRGPNYWSKNINNVIVLKLEVDKLEDSRTDINDSFLDSLEIMMPSLKSRRCSLENENGFSQRVNVVTSLSHVVEQIALELQSLAGMKCDFGCTYSTDKPCVYNVVISYVIESAGIYAANTAVKIVQSLYSNLPYDIADDVTYLQKIYDRKKLGPSTQSIVNEAEKRNIPWTRLNNNSLLMLGQGCSQKIICASVACTTSSIAVDLASDKESTSQLLSKALIPVPKGLVVENEEELRSAVKELGFPLVTKPINGNHGRGITTRIISEEQALIGFKYANQISREVIVEKFIEGHDYRFLVIDFKLVAVAKRIPAMIMGDSKGSTIQQLIDETNKDDRRGYGHEKVLTKIQVDENTQSILVGKNLTVNSILPSGEILFLKDTANISSGGTAQDVTDSVHPFNIFLAERIARLMNLDICGIDIMCKDVTIPMTENTGAVLEVNAGPGLRMHLSPSLGAAKNVAEPIINMLYKNNAPARIPVVAVTGTNGKTTVTRLIAHIAKSIGRNVGYTTTDGIYINGNCICYGDCSGPSSAAAVLRDPIVDFAVLECARGGILRSGLGFDKCNISIVTNITEDHLGLNDIHTLNELAEVKAVIPNTTFNDGYAILNADDELVYKMKHNLECNVALFSMYADNAYVLEHCKLGGLAAIVEQGYFVICKDGFKTRIAKVDEVPLTLNGRADCMMKNILPALLSSVISDFSIEQIQNAIKSFYPSPENTPGRMNIFEFGDFRLMLDYAHNTDGYLQLKKYILSEQATKKVGVIAATGDRRDEDIKMLGVYSAQMFDEIIIRHDEDGRGRTNQEITNLLIEGIKETNDNIIIHVISDEKSAIQYAVNNAISGAFIFVCTDKVRDSIDFIKILQNSDKSVTTIN